MLSVVAGVLAYVARQENRRATQNLGFAKDAVDQTLSSSGLDPASAGADVPQMTEFRRQLLEKAKSFYDDFLKQDASSEALRREKAQAHLRLGHIDRWLEKADEAAREYQQAATFFEALGRESGSADYRQGLANAHNWLGLTLTPIPGRAADAKAYATALALRKSGARIRRVLITSRRQRGHTTAASCGRQSQRTRRSAPSKFSRSDRLLEPLGNAAQIVSRRWSSRAPTTASPLLATTRVLARRGSYESAVALDEALTKMTPKPSRWAPCAQPGLPAQPLGEAVAQSRPGGARFARGAHAAEARSYRAGRPHLHGGRYCRTRAPLTRPHGAGLVRKLA